MSRLRMTKAALADRRRRLIGYERALPSLELKRQQLMIDLAAERAALARLEDAAAALIGQAGAIRFAADRQVVLDDVLAVQRVERSRESRLGVSLPRLDRICWQPLALDDAYPPWVHFALVVTRTLAETRLHVEVAQLRVASIHGALRKTIQRINLLQQVLMPQARRDIGRIGTFLADGQRLATARTKLAVAQRARRVMAGP